MQKITLRQWATQKALPLALASTLLLGAQVATFAATTMPHDGAGASDYCAHWGYNTTAYTACVDGVCAAEHGAATTAYYDCINNSIARKKAVLEAVDEVEHFTA